MLRDRWTWRNWASLNVGKSSQKNVSADLKTFRCISYPLAILWFLSESDLIIVSVRPDWPWWGTLQCDETMFLKVAYYSQSWQKGLCTASLVPNRHIRAVSSTTHVIFFPLLPFHHSHRHCNKYLPVCLKKRSTSKICTPLYCLVNKAVFVCLV